MKNDTTISIGVIGVGHLGDFHLKRLNEISNINISGIYDIDILRLKEMSSKHNVKIFSSLKKLLNKSDAILIVTPTPTHFNIANNALDNNCHLFIEKPIVDNLGHAKKLINKAKRLNKIIQVGHIERFNPAFNIIKNKKIYPRFIEIHRLSKYNERGNDVPVILDLMIHDLDIILSLIKSKIKNIFANGVKVASSTVDMANARIEFEDGCIANITASRISQKNMRKMRIFQENDYITIDFEKGKIEEFLVYNTNHPFDSSKVVAELSGKEKKYIIYNNPSVIEYDALKKELCHFIDSIRYNRQPETNGESATKALDLALKIQNLINK